MNATATTTLKKQKSHAFGKDVYLLGRFKDGSRFWLEAPKWDCGWYWACGYIETYQNNRNPENAKDIDSHTHYDSLLFKKHEYYDHEKGCFRLGSNYMHKLSDHPGVKECVLTESEQWQLSDYMKSMYTLKEAAEVFGRGGSHITTTPDTSIKDPELTKRINEVELPKLFKAIEQLLAP